MGDHRAEVKAYRERHAAEIEANERKELAKLKAKYEPSKEQ